MLKFKHHMKYLHLLYFLISNACFFFAQLFASHKYPTFSLGQADLASSTLPTHSFPSLSLLSATSSRTSWWEKRRGGLCISQFLLRKMCFPIWKFPGFRNYQRKFLWQNGHNNDFMMFSVQFYQILPLL